MPDKSPRYSASDLVGYATALLRAEGLEDAKAPVVAEILVEADLMGHTTHGLHLLVGLLGLLYLLLRSRRSSDEVVESKRVARAGAVAIYWHFMDALWIYLFLLLFVWRSQ